MLCVAADGVWSTVRALAGARARSRFTGQVAWRATRRLEGDDRALSAICAPDVVSAFLHPGFHLIAYPVRAGSAINLAAFTPGAELAEGWSSAPDASPLVAATRDVAGPLAALIASTAAWTAWPIHDVDMEIPWTASSGLALIGDAAHAMTPFAAQGAAMAIEDAETLAASIAAGPDTAASLASWERMRRRRVRRVARRGAFNRFVWHAGGAVAAARDLVLRARRPEKLAADLDWLYGWEPPVSDGGSSSGKAGSPPGVA